MLPLIELKGNPFEQGLIHGRQAHDRIKQNLRLYFDRFRNEVNLSREEVLRRAAAYWGAMQGQSPDYADAMRGVAEGAGRDLLEIVALNVRYEIFYHGYTAAGLVDGCTTFAALPEITADKHLLMGANWDWIPQVQGVVLHTQEEDLEVLSFSEAGIVGGKAGFNSLGLGLAINGLYSMDADWSRLDVPFHVRCFEILRKRNINDAVEVVVNGTRACSANYLIAQVDDQIVNVEAAPMTTHLLTPKNGFMAHTNHFMNAASLGVVEPSWERPQSLQRLQRLCKLLSPTISLTVEQLQNYLRDHDSYPYSICSHINNQKASSEHYQTVTSVLMDLQERSLWISDGPPCTNPYYKLTLENIRLFDQ